MITWTWGDMKGESDCLEKILYTLNSVQKSDVEIRTNSMVLSKAEGEEVWIIRGYTEEEYESRYEADQAKRKEEYNANQKR